MQQTTLTPGFAADFQCIGGDCEDHCCQGWTIALDKASCKRYKKCGDIEIRQLAEQITISKDSQQNWGKMGLNEQGNCLFMDHGGLCQIHSKLGHKALSPTCQTYPRSTRVQGALRFESMTISCPEVCRKVLFSANAFQFSASQSGSNVVGLAAPAWVEVAHNCATAMLSESSLNWRTALYAIGLLAEFVEGIEKDPMAALRIEHFAQALLNKARQGELGCHFSQLPNTNNHHNRMLQAVVVWLQQNGPLSHKQSRGASRRQQAMQALEALLQGGQLQIEPLQQAQQQVLDPYLDEQPQLMAQFLFYRLYHNGFPAATDSPIAQFVDIAFDCFLLEHYLLAISVQQGQLSDADVVQVFQSYHSTRFHNKQFTKFLREILKEYRCNTVAAAVALLKR
ncbi:flagellin lysine-N-methylase [uncultured Ferrimonas sp.]|uniref:flagellin lysine-N-methylase n=1 Tax=uncultured Ferrimonas sp. TaxID=432640 RepID=UPI002634515B|nr:flagellin lysine-N-methylase [uncultured Ferrimonas sp.]